MRSPVVVTVCALFLLGILAVFQSAPRSVVAQEEVPKESQEVETILDEDITPLDVRAAPKNELLAIKELDEKLDKVVSVNFEKMPVREIIESIAEEINADVFFDEEALAQEGNDLRKETITFKLTRTKITARRALELLERRIYAMTIINHSGLILVTTEFGIAADIRIYYVGDLLEESRNRAKSNQPSKYDKESREVAGGGIPHFPEPDLHWDSPEARLSRLIQNTTGIGTWYDTDQGNGYIHPIDDLLVIRQTDDIHNEIRQLLDAMRTIKKRGTGASTVNASETSRSN